MTETTIAQDVQITVLVPITFRTAEADIERITPQSDLSDVGNAVLEEALIPQLERVLAPVGAVLGTRNEYRPVGLKELDAAGEDVTRRNRPEREQEADFADLLAALLGVGD